MKNIGIFQGADRKAVFVVLLFLLFSIEPPILLPFGFPRTTWGVAKIGLLFISLITIWQIWIKQKDFFYKRRSVFFAPALFLLSILLSILFAANLELTSQVLQFLIIALFFYFLAIYYFKKIKEIELFFKVILFLAIFSSFFSFFLVFQNKFQGLQLVHNTLISIFSYEGILRFTGDLQRGRIQTFWFPEFAFPIILYFIFSKKSLRLGVFGLILSVIGILLSNNRYQFFSMCLGSFLFFVLNWRLIRKQKILLRKFFIVTILTVFFSVIVADYFLGKNVFQRFLLSDYKEDVSGLESRQYLFNQAWDMFLSAPIFGVGFRNFSFYSTGEQGFFSDPLWELDVPTYYWHLEPHNIFFQVLSETGLFGLVSFLILLAIFLKQDLYLYKHMKGSSKKLFFSALIISSWMYIVNEQFTFINDSLASGVFFWFSRGLLAVFYLKQLPVSASNKFAKQKIMFVCQQWNRFGGVESEIAQLKKSLKSEFKSTIFIFPQKKRWHPLVFFLLWWKLLKEKPRLILSYSEYCSIVTAFVLIFYPFNFKFFVCEHNNPTVFFQKQRLKWFKKQLIRFFYSQVACKIIVISETIKKEFVRNFMINGSKIEIISISLPIKEILKMSNKEIDLPKGVEEKKYFVSVGRLNREKRFSYLIDVFNQALKQDNNLKLLIIGDGPERIKLRRQIKNLLLKDNVFLLGWQENPYPFIKKAIALVITSSTEGVPRVAIEAKACKTPIIVTNYRGVEEIIDDKKNNLLVGLNDKISLKEAILNLSKFDKKLIKNSRAERLAGFQIEKNIKKYKEIFKQNLA